MMVFDSTNRVTRAILVLLFILVAFGNLIILSLLETHTHQKRESVIESFFLFHVHQNVSVSGHRNGLENDESVVQPTADRKEPTFLPTHVRTNARTNVREDTVRRSAENTKATHVFTTQMKEWTKRFPRSEVPSYSKKETFQRTSKMTAEPGTRPSPTTITQTRRLHKQTTAALPAALTQPPQIHDCETWCRRGNDLKPPYKLTAVLLVRIYRKDLAGLTSREMLQWMQYLRYAGFQHVYVYDAFVYKSESQLELLGPFIQSGYVTYVDWSARNPYTIQGTQVAAYQDCLDKFGSDSEWQAAIDIDEYPFSPSDLEQNFMERFLAKFSRENPDISEITMKNYLFLGKPLDHESNPLLIDRIRRRTHDPANALVKPIYRPSHVGSAQVHHNGMRRGGSTDSDEHSLRMNHYWGARLQNWGEDTPKILEITRPDFSIRLIVQKLNGCSKCLGPDTLYIRRWN